jgi:hypothetical protein
MLSPFHLPFESQNNIWRGTQIVLLLNKLHKQRKYQETGLTNFKQVTQVSTLNCTLNNSYLSIITLL